jgi:antirestriction protein ArdC
MGAAFVCEHLEISPELPDDHASYIASWILALQDDKHAIVKAASFAQKAVDYLAALQSNALGPDTDPDLPPPAPDPQSPA